MAVLDSLGNLNFLQGVLGLFAIITVTVAIFHVLLANKNFLDGEFKRFSVWVMRSMVFVTLHVLLFSTIQFVHFIGYNIPQLDDLFDLLSLILITVAGLYFIRAISILDTMSKVYGFKEQKPQSKVFYITPEEKKESRLKVFIVKKKTRKQKK